MPPIMRKAQCLPCDRRSGERRAIIESRGEKALAAAGLMLVPDEGLVIENAGLTEWPVPMLAASTRRFLRCRKKSSS
jgi:glycyl-tRNA synthetase beta subunit